MKKFFAFLLAMMFCLSMCSCKSLLKKAKSYVTGNEESEMPSDYVASGENEEYKYDIYKTYIVITKYLGSNTNVDIPSEINGKTVKRIGSLCFFDTEAAVASVNIPDSVTAIDESAFYYCDHLESIVIPDTVESIGGRAFAWCNSLESVVLGKGIKAIPDFCFNHCEYLKDIVITENISSVGIRAFSYCSALKDITLPEGVKSVGERAFADNALLEFVVFENNGTELGKNVFASSDSVVIIAPDGSNAKNYCESNGLRWSNSKSVPATVLGGTDSSAAE